MFSTSPPSHAFNLCHATSPSVLLMQAHVSYLPCMTTTISAVSSNGTCGTGAGVGGVPHKFMYPKEDKENYQVLQFASQAAGSQGLATYVQQISEASIKVLLLPMC